MDRFISLLFSATSHYAAVHVDFCKQMLQNSEHRIVILHSMFSTFNIVPNTDNNVF